MSSGVELMMVVVVKMMVIASWKILSILPQDIGLGDDDDGVDEHNAYDVLPVL